MKGSVIDEKQTNHPSNELTDLNTIDVSQFLKEFSLRFVSLLNSVHGHGDFDFQ